MAKILHIGMSVAPVISKELHRLGSYRFFDWTQYMELGEGFKELLNRDLLKVSEQCDPDITFLHVQRPGVIDVEVAKQLRGYVINYTYDVARPIPQWYYDIGKHINTTIFCDEPGMWEFRADGINSDFSLPGYDDSVFRTNGSKGVYGDIVFLGNNYDRSQNFHNTQNRADIVDFLKENYKDSFKVYGNNWSYNDGNLMYKEQKEAECYRSCKIAISMSHFDLERYTSDRIFRILGSGAFCLSKWYPGVEKDFTDKVHLRIWKTESDLKELIDYYLIHEDERSLIAANGNKLAISTATWAIRIKNIIDMAKARISKEYKSRTVKVAQENYIKAVEKINTDSYQIVPQELPESAFFTEEPIEVKQVEFLDEIPVSKIFDQNIQKEYLKLYSERRIDYSRLKDICIFKLKNEQPVDVSVIIPVRSRANFNKVLTKHLKMAMEFYPNVTYSITFVEYSMNTEHMDICDDDVNYINVPFGGYFNKCMAFNVGAFFSNKAKYYLFHDLDIIMDKYFFSNIFKNLENNKDIALQTFKLRRVLYCNEHLSEDVIKGIVPIEKLTNRYPGVTEPMNPEQMKAPGGSIFVSKTQFLNAGGYDPELFFGYSIEDQFFYDKLQLTGGIISCNNPAIELYHLHHPPLWSSNPFLSHHHLIYTEFSKLTLEEKQHFLELEKSNISKFL